MVAPPDAGVVTASRQATPTPAPADPDSPPPTAAGSRPLPPPAAPTTALGGQLFKAPDLTKFDFTKVLAGDWLGSGLTAVATLASVFVLAVGALLVMHPDGISVHEFLASATILTGAAFGGDVSTSQSHTYAVGYYPLTLTFVAFAIAKFLLRRQLAKYDSLAGAIGHVVRTAVILGVGLMILTLAMRTNIQVPHTFAFVGGEPTWNSLTGFDFLKGDMGIRTVGVVFLSIFYMLLIGTWLITDRTGWMHPRVTMVRSWVEAPVKAFGIVLAGVTALGVVAAVILFVLRDASHNPTTLMVWLLSLPNMGIVALGLGAGAPFIIDTNSPRKGGDDTMKHYLAHYADTLSSWMWLLPAGTAVVLVLSVLYVARKSTYQAISAKLLSWVAVTTVLLPVLAHYGAFQLAFHAKVHRKSGDWYLGIDPWILLGLGLAWTFGLAVIFVGIARARSGASPASATGPHAATAVSGNPRPPAPETQQTGYTPAAATPTTPGSVIPPPTGPYAAPPTGQPAPGRPAPEETGPASTDPDSTRQPPQ